MLNLTNCSYQGDDLDASCSDPAKCRRAGVGGCARRVDVVDETHGTRGLSFGDHAAAHVSASVGESEPLLTRERAATAEWLAGGQIPEIAERGSEPSGRNDSASPSALRVAGNVRKRVHLGSPDHLGDERRCLDGELSAPVLLPRADERLGTTVVDDSRTGTSEGEAATRAFGAAPDRPGTGRAAALADGWAQAD